MALTRKRKMTEKKLAANRANGRKSRGAVTPEGKARAARAHLRQDGYVQAQDGALAVLGEDPREYARFMQSLENNLGEGLRGELVQRIGDILWQMKRSVRIQNGLAAKRVQIGLQIGQMLAGPKMLKSQEIYEGLCAIGRMLNREDSTPAPGEIAALESAFGATPPENVREIFPLLRSYGEAAAKSPGPVNENSAPATIEGREREAAAQKLHAAVDAIFMSYALSSEMLEKEYDKVQSPENIAALMAPGENDSVRMQRMEDSNLRQLWRLTNILAKVRSGALE